MIDTSELNSVDLIALISVDVSLRKVANTDGGEWAGPCPRCGGTDRFRVWPAGNGKRPRFWCRQCQIKGDAVDYVKLSNPDLSFREAIKIVLGHAPTPAQRRQRLQWRTEPTTPPIFTDEYQTRAHDVLAYCQDCLRSEHGFKAMAWLRARGLTRDTIKEAGLGFHPSDGYDPAKLWGMDREKPVFRPRGIVIPWFDGALIRRLNVRRATGEPKYLSLPGFSNWLYGALSQITGSLVVLVEGEFDAITLAQEVGIDRITPLATGSVTGARVPELVEKLKTADGVLVAFDADDAGDKAAAWWLGRLENARRLRPTRHDANQMLQDGENFEAWLGLDRPPVATQAPLFSLAEQRSFNHYQYE